MPLPISDPDSSHCADSTQQCFHFKQVVNVNSLYEVSKGVSSWMELSNEGRIHIITDLVRQLRSHDPQNYTQDAPHLMTAASLTCSDTLELIAATIRTYLGQRLSVLVSPHSFRDGTACDPRTSLEEISQIHRNSSGHVLTFQLGAMNAACTPQALEQALPADLRCHHLVSLLHAVAISQHSSHHVQVLRTLIEDILLAQLDTQITDQGVGYLRKGGNGIVTALSAQALAAAEEAVRSFTYTTHWELRACEQTYVAPTEDFAFLAPDITATLSSSPPSSTHDPRADQVLYVGKDGARLNVAKGRLVVTANSQLPELSLPCNLVSRIVLSGNVGFSAGARSWALRTHVPVTFLSRRGGYQGHLVNAGALHGHRLLQQFKLTQDRNLALPLARAIVQAKLRNHIHVLHRLARRTPNADVADQCQAIRSLSEECSHAGNHHELMGLEGAASEIYFAAASKLLPEDVRFSGRTRRPPRDLANAALSYGYALLLSECVGALVACGLEPSLGVLHSVTDKRPSLALDLMEEFRPLLVDQTVFALLRAKRLRPQHAVTDPTSHGVWLGREGKKILTDAYEATLQRSVRGALPGFAGSWRRHIAHEAQLLARAMVETSYQWSGVVWR